MQTKTVTVHRDQAVWEREFLQVEVPADTPHHLLHSVVLEMLDTDQYTELCEPKVQDAVEGMSTEISVTSP